MNTDTDPELEVEWYGNWLMEPVKPNHHVVFQWTREATNNGTRLHGFGQTEQEASDDLRKKIDERTRMGS